MLCMNAIFIYNPLSGHHINKRKINYAKTQLEKRFQNIELVASLSADHFRHVIKNSCGKYDVLIIAGGDGTINMALNIIAKETNRPILCIIPHGTVNDGIRNIGGSPNFKKSIKNIVNNSPKDIDIFSVNNHYCLYVAATGAYSDLSYITPNKDKLIFGKFAYYFRAIPRFFHKIRINGKVRFEGKEITFTSPFILILNGKRMGGFTINKSSKLDDGKIELYLAKSSFGNSLPKYFLRRNSIPKYSLENFTIELDSKCAWDFDGEKYEAGNVEVKVLKKHLKVIV